MTHGKYPVSWEGESHPDKLIAPACRTRTLGHSADDIHETLTPILLGPSPGFRITALV